MSSFIAAGSAYATHGINTIPFFIYYSMFGMQRVGDLVWAAADTRTRDSCLAAPGRTTTRPAKGCSIRMAIRSCSRWPCRI
jgi:pyruvate dehydrogenase E1 component